MKIALFLLVLLLVLPVSANGAELIAPEAPDSARNIMPESADFGDGLQQILRNVIPQLRPDLAEVGRVSFAVIAAVLMVSVLQTINGSVKFVSDFAGAVGVSSVLLLSAHSLISLAAQTITEMSEYGKLLLPVMTAGMAAQGGITGSVALYSGTALFNAVLTGLVSKFMVPMVYIYLALSTANSAIGEDLLKRMRDLLKSFVSWCLKTLLTVFTTYMSITGVVSGTTDAAALKATRVTISSFVPVVGSILSDASEAVLVSAGLAKNAAGIYGILAILAVFLRPFLQIGIHYLVLKFTSAVCGIFGTKRLTELISDFSTAMGLLLAMTGTSCLLLLISTVCFLKGVG